MKKILAVIAVLALSVGGWLGYGKYQEDKFMDSIRPSIKNASLRMANTLHYEIAVDTKITFKEFFEKIESDISEIDKKILEIQSLEIPKYSKKVTPILAYMKGSQELLRALLTKSRKGLAVSSALDWYRSSLDEYRTSSGYGVEYARKRLDKAKEDADKAFRELVEAKSDLVKAANSLSMMLNEMSKTLSPDLLFDSKNLLEIVKKNIPEEKDKSGK